MLIFFQCCDDFSFLDIWCNEEIAVAFGLFEDRMFCKGCKQEDLDVGKSSKTYRQ